MLLQARAEPAVVVHEHFGVGRKLHAEAGPDERGVAAEEDAGGSEATPRNADERSRDLLRGVEELMAPAEAKLGGQRAARHRNARGEANAQRRLKGVVVR